MLTMKKLYRALVIATCGIMITASSPEKSFAQDDFERQVADYIQKFPYQETFDYVMRLTGGDAGKLNTWVMASRDLLKAGEDKIVRCNNDTLYKTAFVYLGDGPCRYPQIRVERFTKTCVQVAGSDALDWSYEFVKFSCVGWRCVVQEDGFDLAELPGLQFAADCSGHGGAWHVVQRFQNLGRRNVRNV